MAFDISTSADVIDVRDIIERFDMAITGETIEALVAAAQAVLRSADDTGCSEDLTVVSQASIQQLQEALWQIRQ